MNYRVFYYAGLIALTGCANMGDRAPQARLKAATDIAASQHLSQTDLSIATWPATDWWLQLGDAQLDTLIREALRDNPDLAAAQARLQLASAQTIGADADRQPRLDAKASTPFSPNSNELPLPKSGYTTAKQVNLTGSYTLDLWGGARANWETALGQQKAAEVDTRAAALTLSTRVVQAYSDLAYAFATHDIAEADHERAQKLLDLTRQRVKAGIDSLALQRQAESMLASAEQQQAQTARKIESVRTQLAILLGQGPDRGLAIARPQTLKVAPLALPENLPADLVGRRPDIVAARWRVEAASHAIDAAKTRFYPNVNLSATVGVLSMHTSSLFESSSKFGVVTPAISLPLFEGGKLRADLASRDAEYDLNVAQYNKTLITAFNDVADSLGQLRSLKIQEKSQQQALESARQAWDLSTQRYRNGVGGYLEVLTVQQALYQAEARLAEIQSRNIEASINLVRALGGGYQPDTQAAPTRTANTQEIPK